MAKKISKELEELLREWQIVLEEIVEEKEKEEKDPRKLRESYKTFSRWRRKAGLR